MSQNKYFETGSNPYYLNINNTAKEVSNNETTNSSYSLVETLGKFTIIQDDYEIEPPVILDEVHISKIED